MVEERRSNVRCVTEVTHPSKTLVQLSMGVVRGLVHVGAGEMVILPAGITVDTFFRPCTVFPTPATWPDFRARISFNVASLNEKKTDYQHSEGRVLAKVPE